MQQGREDGRTGDGGAGDRRVSDRRHGDRRREASQGGRRHGDRRGRDRRLQLTGAGLLGVLAFTMGARQMAASRMAQREEPIAWSHPDPGVDVFQVPSGPALPAIAGSERTGDWRIDTLEPIIQEAAALHGLPANLIRAVIQTESQFKPDAVSRVGAQGLMQLMPRTARHLGVNDPLDPRENVLGGTKYLSTLLKRFGGNTARALAAYNAGPTVVARYRGLPPYRETQGYVKKIHKLVDNTDAEFALPAQPRVRRASLRAKARSANVRKSKATKVRRGKSVKKASTKRASIRKAAAKKTSVKKKATRSRRAARRG